MRIACPFCGARELGEFTYLGDAAPQRPPGAPDDAGEDAFYDYVYLRDNVAGEHARATGITAAAAAPG